MNGAAVLDGEKRVAAEAAVELVEDSMTLGLGTGSTVAHLLPALAARGLDLRCVATSPRTGDAARSLGIRVEDVASVDRVDLAIDGADQVAPDFWLVKGGGAAHTREKLVAAAADRFVVIADSSKPVERLHGPVPVELLRFALSSTLNRLGPVTPRGVPESPDGGVIADWRGELDDPAAVAALLSASPGVVEHGLFPPSMVSAVIVGRGSGAEQLDRRVSGATGGTGTIGWSELPDAALVEPSIYAADLMRLGEQVDALMDAGVRAIHVDIGDGHFVAPVILGDIVVEAIARRVHPRGGLVDCHMMVADPDRHVGRIAAAGGDSFTFHLEASDDPERTTEAIRGSGLQVGVAASPDTTMAQLAGPATTADLALCMGVHPGLSGQSFLADTVRRVAELRERLPAGVRIQVDGGVDEGNIAALHAAGAHLFVAGSSVFGHDDPTVGYRSLCSRLTAAP